MLFKIEGLHLQRLSCFLHLTGSTSQMQKYTLYQQDTCRAQCQNNISTNLIPAFRIRALYCPDQLKKV
ncbi:hypothetical protein [Mucilaginibacter sp.]